MELVKGCLIKAFTDDQMFFLKRDSVSLSLLSSATSSPGLWCLYHCGHMVVISDLASYCQTDGGTGQVTLSVLGHVRVCVSKPGLPFLQYRYILQDIYIYTHVF